MIISIQRKSQDLKLALEKGQGQTLHSSFKIWNDQKF